MYTGKMTYNNIGFDFSLCGEDLTMVPFDEDEDKARALVDTKINGGWASGGKSKTIEQNWLWAEPRNTHSKLVLFPKSKNLLKPRFMNASLKGTIRRYFSFFTSDHDYKIDKIKLESKALDYLLDARKTYIDYVSNEDGTHEVKLKPVVEDTQKFKLDGITVNIRLITSVILSRKIGKPPLYGSSYIELTFAETDDYAFVDELISYTEQLIQFSVYARNFEFDNIELLHIKEFGSDGEKRYYYHCVATVNDELPCSPYPITERIKKECFVPLGVFHEFEASLFRGLIDKTISTDHIPDSHEETNRYSKARIIVLATAFDWSFTRLFPSGIDHSPKSVEASNIVINSLTDLAEQKRQKKEVKEQAKRAIKVIREGDSFSSKIMHFQKKYPQIFEALGIELYASEGLEFKTSKIANRTQKLRNDLAHGNQSIVIDINLLVDSIFLERIVLAMQLICLGIDDTEAIISTVNKARN